MSAYELRISDWSSDVCSSDLLELLLYIPPQHGKKVQAGTPLQIAPSTAKREEFGTLIGTVKSISAFPVTLDGMRAALQNDELARTFSREGPPFMARVSLRPAPSPVSGYDWTSDRGRAIAPATDRKSAG